MKKEVKKFIVGLRKEKLLSYTLELCESNEVAQEFFELKIDDNPVVKIYSKEILNKYKKKIDYWFFIHDEFDADTEKAWEVVEKFHKTHKGYPEFYLELLIYWIKSAVEYASGICVDYGAYYDGMTEVFEKALKIAKNNQLFDQYEECFLELLNSCEPFGWATYDIMSDMLEKYKSNKK